MASLHLEQMRTAAQAAATLTKNASNELPRGFNEVYITIGKLLNSEETAPFSAITLAAADGKYIIDYETKTKLPKKRMSALVVHVACRETQVSLVLIGPDEHIQAIATKEIRADNSEGGFTIYAPLLDKGVQTVRFWQDGSLWLTTSDEKQGATKKVEIALDGTLTHMNTSVPYPPAFSIVFIQSGTDNLRQQMQGLDVFLI